MGGTSRFPFSHSGGGVGKYPGAGGTFPSQCFSHVSNGGAYQGIAWVEVGFLCLLPLVACQETARLEVGPLGLLVVRAQCLFIALSLAT